MTDDSKLFSPTDIAIVGMAARFPGAHSTDEFWRNIRDGRESIEARTDEQLLAAGEDTEALADPAYVKRASILEGFDLFDPEFFGLSQKEAAIMDPQHRLLLECASDALEHSGHDPQRFKGAIGVFAGCGMNAYFMFNLLANRKLMNSTGLFLVRHTGNDKDFLSTRISYALNLRGPSVNVQTACSTSLVAIHLACQSLINGETDLALAGGVTIELPHARGYVCQEGEILSKDGRCRAFDADASGTVFGSGGGLVLLRRLSDAMENGDTIHAVIKATAVNNDGAGKVGYLAPSVEGQAAAIEEAIAMSGVPAESITYVEAHGTGTRVGDPIEIQALTQAFRRFTKDNSFCGIGSVKTNIGHLDTAAGVASVIKTVEALKHRQLPPSLHYRAPNPLLDLAKSPFYVNAELRNWEAGDEPRRAGINCLGVGGTNAHAILEEAPEAPIASKAHTRELLIVSARSESALAAAIENLGSHFAPGTNVSVGDAAYTLQAGRRPFAYRAAVVCGTSEEANTLLASSSKKIIRSKTLDVSPKVAFLFAGGGAQYAGMGTDLYRENKLYRETIDECLAIVRADIGVDLREILLPGPEALAATRSALEKPSTGLVALFITEYAVAKLWMALGIKPDILIGHSAGDHAAACIAGVITVRDGLRSIALRARLLESSGLGAMLSVQLSEPELTPYLDSSLSIAAINGPKTSVISGAAAAIERLQKRLTGQNIDCARVRIATAAHSPLLDPYLDEFRSLLASFSLQPPRIPIVSCLTGKQMTAEQATDPDFWTRQFRHTIRFTEALKTAESEPRWFLEAGPGATLTSLVKLQHGKAGDAPQTLLSLPHSQDPVSAWEPLLGSLGRFWTAGAEIQWDSLYEGERRRRIPLPTYPFQRRRFWIDADSTFQPSAPLPVGAPADDGLPHFYEPCWERAAPAVAAPLAKIWVVFADALGVGDQLRKELEAKAVDVVMVSAGERFARSADRRYQVRPSVESDYRQLFEELAERRLTPTGVVHLWSVMHRADSVRVSLDHCFHSLVLLARTLSDIQTEAIDLRVVSNNLYAAAGSEASLPLRALLLGPCRVIKAEYPNFSCQHIDVGLAAGESAETCVPSLLAELARAPSNPVLALRQERHALSYQPAIASGGANLLWKKGGAYVITGGFGGIGYAVAQSIAKRFAPKIALIGRSRLPARDSWDAWLKSHSDADAVSTAIRQVRLLEQDGAQVLAVSADVTDAKQMGEGIASIKAAFGHIDGLLHAAGVLNDGLIHFKDAESMERVLGPKVLGTLVLSELLQDEKLDFSVLFSSTSALLGLPGQVDYAAANSFLDSFAASESGKRLNAVSINWGVWKETGMTARLAASPTRGAEAAGGKTAIHPLLGNVFMASAAHTVYLAIYKVQDLWTLGEHRTAAGQAVLPGSAYVEMVRAAMEQAAPSQPIEIRDLHFLAPIQVGESDSDSIHVDVRKNAEAYTCTVTSGGRDGIENVTGTVYLGRAHAAEAINLKEIGNRCGPLTSVGTSQFLSEQVQHLRFGPRWDVLQSVQVGSDELLASLQLPKQFLYDLDIYRIHPAILDVATGVGLKLLPGYAENSGLFVPVAYESVTIFGPLGDTVYSYVKRRTGRGEAGGTATFDVVIADAGGTVLMRIEGFTVKRIDAAFKQPNRAASRTVDPRLLEMIDSGLTTEQGIRALDLVLSGPCSGQMVVTAIPLTQLTAAGSLQTSGQNGGASSGAADGANQGRDEIESFLIDLWRDLLGVHDVGLQDDFFELGGHSLIAVRLFSRLKKKYHKEFGLATLFTARSVESQAALIRGSDAKPRHQFSALVPIRERGSLAPLFLVAGMGGNVVGFEPLVRHLDPERPVYGLQSIGMDGLDEVLTKVEDMAARYLSEVRLVQPQGPYNLCGYSFGGLIAYEMAQQLSESGEEVGFLGLLDTYQQTYLDTLPKAALTEVLSAHRSRFSKHFRTLAFGPNRFEYVCSRFELFHVNIAKNYLYKFYLKIGRPLPRNNETVRYINPIAGGNYQPMPFKGRLTLFRAQVREPGERFDVNLGWSDLAAGGLNVIEIPGRHIDIGEEPNVQVLARKVSECMEETQKVSAAGA